jgi:RNA polymerase sigma-70 factor (ECF subfamily)
MRQSWTDYANDRGIDIPADEADEQLLLQRLAQGDRLAFWGIWMSYQEEFFSRCLHWMGGNRAEAEDALSSACLRAWKYLPAYAKDVVNVKGWLIQLLHNHCMNIRQSLRRRDHMMQKISILSHLQPEWHPMVGESPEEVVSRQEILQNVHGAIGNLPPRLYETAQLRLVGDLSYREIATRLDLSPENARKRMEQARCLLRTSLVGTALVSTASKE